jgi:TonB-linked SusC/RagA family outer membrane protein
MKKEQHLVASIMTAMKITFIQLVISIMFAGTLFANEAKSQSILQKTFSINLEKVELKKVINEVQKQTNVKFSFSPNTINTNRIMSYYANPKTISDFLGDLKSLYNIDSKFIDERLILFSQNFAPITNINSENTNAALVADKIIIGKVTNEKGEPLEGVSVKVKGKSTATLSLADGSFSLKNIPDQSTLILSYIGYISSEIKVSGSTKIDIVLKQANNNLDEVVVVGYGTSTRRLNVGSYSTVKGDAVANLPVQSFEAALNGKATGVNMIANSGVVNQAPVFRIRGVNSLSLSSYPLVVVDGVPVYVEDINVGGNASNNPLAFLNPNDIESVDIAKDAAATSIYGSRGANGVVFITTKSGKVGKTKVTYDVTYSSSEATRLASVLNAEQYLEIKNEGLVNANTYNATTNYYGTSIGPDGATVKTNWYDYIFRKAAGQTHSVSMSGATAATKYFFSVSYANQEGILKGNNYGRKSVTYNIDHKVNSWLSIGSKTNYTDNVTQAILSTGNGVSSTASNSVAYRLALVAAPIIGPYNRDGSYNVSGLNLALMDNQGHLTSQTRLGYTNPVITLAYNDDNTANNFIQSNVYAQLKPTKWLTFKTLYGIDNISSRTNRYFDPRTNEGNTALGSATGISSKRESYTLTNTLTAEKSFKEHSLNLLLGQEVQNKTGDQFGLIRSNQSDPFYSNIQGGFSTIAISNTANQVYYKYFNSLFSRLQYNYQRKYFLTGSVRNDESSLLGKNNKSGLFYSYSGAWDLTNEEFFKNSEFGNFFENFRLRASYGKVGNLTGIGDYASLTNYSANLYGGLPGLYFSTAGNQDLAWETSKKFDVGVSFSVLKGRVSGDISYYKNNIDGLIFGVPTPASAGLPGSTQNSVLSNVGSMYNKGYEVSLNVIPVQTKDFTWSSNFNFSFNENMVTELSPTVPNILYGSVGGSTDCVSITLPGYSVGMIYAIRTFGVDVLSGRRVFLDGSGRKVLYEQVPVYGKNQWEYEDGTKAPAIATATDAVVYKNTTPKIYGGFTNTFTYKKLTLNTLFTYQFGGYMYYGTQGTLMDARFANNSTMILRRWRKPGDMTDVPKVQDGDFTSWGYSLPLTANVYSSDYIRLKNVTLSYTLPEKLTKRAQISDVSIFVSGQNLLLFTPYPGADPEVTSQDNSSATQGFDRNMMPNAKIYTVGLKVNF